MGSSTRRIVWPAAVSDLESAPLRGRFRSTPCAQREIFGPRLRHYSERATVITDVVILLPLLLTMIGGMFMMGTRISDYMYLSQGSRELGLILSKMPFMYELQYSDEASRTFKIEPNKVVPASTRTEAEVCIQTVSDPQYTGCKNTAGGDCSCALKIARWYATEFMRLKLILLKEGENFIYVKVDYSARPLDTSSGLCFIDVTSSAAHRAWAMVGGGDVRVEAHVPYVSNPVPWNGGTCKSPQA